MTDEKKMCEAYYVIEDNIVKDGVNSTYKKVVLQGIGNTPDEAFNLFVRVKEEMKK